PKYLFDYSIKKYHLKVTNRKDLKKSDPEYNFDPAKLKIKSDEKDNIKESDQVKRTVIDDIEQSFSAAIDVGFMPNQGNSVGAINLCFIDCVVPFAAYKQLINIAKDGDVIV